MATFVGHETELSGVVEEVLAVVIAVGLVEVGLNGNVLGVKIGVSQRAPNK